MSGLRRFTSAEATAYGFLTVTAVFCLLPFLWVMLASVDPNASLFLALPRAITADHFVKIFTAQNGGRWFFN